MEKTVSIFLWLSILIFLAILCTGYLAGEEYNGKEDLYLNYKVPYVWEVLVDYGNVGFGKSDVKSVETIGRYYNLYIWTEHLKNGGFRTYKQIYKEENKELTLELTDSSYGLTGTWHFILKDQKDDTIVTIEEKSKNKSILRRGVLYYIDKGRETSLWVKYLRVRLFGKLLSTP